MRKRYGITSEIPYLPIRSLGQLQHLDIAMDNPYPPMTPEQIGNSNASYLIAPDAIKRDNGMPDGLNCSLDHSYIGNHLLFDDWFVSSINTNTDTL
ncbi:hypothetical protein OAB00_00380 [Akkermansiaceae bacterium]|nr:hypothetical protein [Akkermansiaceae bacterium]